MPVMVSLAKTAQMWSFIATAPQREVFAVMEQMLGTSPYRFEVTGDDEARIVEIERIGFLGQWKPVKRDARWVRVTAKSSDEGTEVVVEASRGGAALSPRRNRAAVTRGQQLVTLLTKGVTDRATVYRERRMPEGPVTLVASWASTAYALFAEPGFDAPRGRDVYTATPMDAIAGGNASFTKVRLGDGTEGYIETDQIVPAPAVATREAQSETASYG